MNVYRVILQRTFKNATRHFIAYLFYRSGNKPFSSPGQYVINLLSTSNILFIGLHNWWVSKQASSEFCCSFVFNQNVYKKSIFGFSFTSINSYSIKRFFTPLKPIHTICITHKISELICILRIFFLLRTILRIHYLQEKLSGA